MKQAPRSINRDLDEEISKAVEHQYARRLIGKHTDASSSSEDASPREHSGDDRRARQARPLIVPKVSRMSRKP